MTTQHNTTNIWEGDLFNRKEFASLITNVISGRKTPFVLNLNSAWGTGKTFFLERWKLELEKNHPVIYYNAWTTDYLDDPLPAFLNAFKEQIDKYIPKDKNTRNKLDKVTKISGNLFKSVLPTIAKGIVEHYVGEDGTTALENAFADSTEKITKDLLKLQKRAESTVFEFKRNLFELLISIDKEGKTRLPIYIIVDELDRCRPNFAISLLEKIKHFFNVENIVFVISTDTEQLAESFSGIYGSKFKGTTYLKRFFDQEYSLPEPNYLQFSLHLLNKHGYDEGYFGNGFPNRLRVDEFIKIFAILAIMSNLSLRDQEQCFEKIHLIQVNWQDAGTPIHYIWLLYLIILYHKHPDKYEMFLDKESMPSKYITKQFNNINNCENYGIDIKTLREVQNKLNIYTKLIEDTFEQITKEYVHLNQSNLNADAQVRFTQIVAMRDHYKSLMTYPSKVRFADMIV